jgi:TonB family protein
MSKLENVAVRCIIPLRMRAVGKLFALLALFGSPAWAQSEAPPTPQGNSIPQEVQSSQTTQNTPVQQNTSMLQSGDSTKLEAIKIVKATYPFEAQEKQLQGQVWVKILVSTTGEVQNVEVISGDPVLAKSAMDAAKRWKFKPFIKDGKPTPVSTKLPFNFAFSENVHQEKIPPEETAPGEGNDPKTVHVAQGVTTGLLIYKVQPVYPPDARQARIQGTVVLRAVIGKDGRIANLQVISGPKELARAAIGAVQQWRYRPYSLMGTPVAVDTEVQVNFQLR